MVRSNILSVFKGVGGCWWFRAFRMYLMGTAVDALWKIPATSASANEETTWRKVLHSTSIAPFGFGCLTHFDELRDKSILQSDSVLWAQQDTRRCYPRVRPCCLRNIVRRRRDTCSSSPLIVAFFLFFCVGCACALAMLFKAGRIV